MKLYKLESSNWETFFGTHEEPIERDVITLAQTPSCDAFLYLSNETYDELELLDSVPSGFIFTYCQEWGLTIDDDVVDRVIIDLRTCFIGCFYGFGYFSLIGGMISSTPLSSIFNCGFILPSSIFVFLGINPICFKAFQV